MAMLKDSTFWVAVSFLIFFFIVWKVGGFKAMLGGLDSHGQKIAEELAEAQRLREDAQKLLAEYEAKRQAAEAEAASIVAAAKDEAKRLAADAESKLADFVARRTKSAEQKIAQAEAQATSEVRAAAAELAAKAAEQVLKKQMAGKSGADMLVASLKEVKSRLN